MIPRKKLFFGLGIFLFFTLIYFSINIPRASAQEDNVDLHISAEASNNNGQNWYNYFDSKSQYSQGVTVTAKPGDTILIRIRLWNTGIGNAYSAEATGEVTNTQYIESYSLISADADGNGRAYDNYFFTPGSIGIGRISQVNSGGGSACTPTSGAECLTISAKLKSNFPSGETIILGGGEITNYSPGGIGKNNSHNKLLGLLFSHAKAAGINWATAFRISVNGGPETQATVLPQTLPPVGTSTTIYLSFCGILLASIFIKILLSQKT